MKELLCRDNILTILATVVIAALMFLTTRIVKPRDMDKYRH